MERKVGYEHKIESSMKNKNHVESDAKGYYRSTAIYPHTALAHSWIDLDRILDEEEWARKIMEEMRHVQVKWEADKKNLMSLKSEQKKDE